MYNYNNQQHYSVGLISDLSKPEEAFKLSCMYILQGMYSLLSGSLALEALLIGVHCKKRYITV